jgi:putative ABC transport system permease protein
MEALWRDVRLGLRSLRKNPGFTAFAVLTLALGIGVNTAMFSLVSNLLLRPLPVEQPSELVAIGWNATHTEAAKPGLSWQSYLEYRDNSSDSFTGLAAYDESVQMGIVRTDGSTVSADAAVVTGNYFELLGVHPFRGRLISSQDDQGVSESNVAVLSHRVWRELFGGRANALGATLRLGNSSYMVVGVAPPDFSGINLDSSPDVWIPVSSVIHANPLVRMMAESVDSTFFKVVGRLKPGVTLVQARQQLGEAAIRLGAGKSLNLGWKTVGGRSVPNEWEKPGPMFEPLENTRGGSSRGSIMLLFGAIALLLLLVVCDIASMLIARMERRRREVAIRLALGASRFQVARAVVAEGLLISVFGAAAGTFVAYWSVKFLITQSSTQIQWHTSLATSVIEGRALIFTIVVTLFSGLFFSLAPAVRALRSNVLLAMNSDAPTSSTGRPRAALRGGLIVFQTSVSVLLLAATLFFLETYWNQSRLHLSYDPHGAFVDIIRGSKTFTDGNAAHAFWQNLVETVKSEPGIRDAALASPPAIVGSFGMPPGRPYWSRVGSDYFSTMGTPLIRGRDFNQQDRDGTPLVAIVNQTLAEQFWPGKNPIGQRVEHVLNDDGIAEVVGVVADTQTRGPDVHEDPVLYTPWTQRHLGSNAGPMAFWLLVRSDGDERSVSSAVHSALDREGIGVTVSSEDSLTEYLMAPYKGLRFEAELFAAFAILAIVLTAAGLYGLIAYVTTARTHEFGLRLALGASQPSIVRLIMRDGLILTLAGVVIGLGAEFVLMRFLSGIVRSVKPVDAPTAGIVALVLFCAALAACYVPARRASRLDPMVALRHE